MDIKKLLVGSLAGGVINFTLGWVIFGMFLMERISANPGLSGNLARAGDPELLYLITGSVLVAMMFTYIFLKANIRSLGGGLINGAVIGLLMSAGSNCVTYATTTIFSKTGMALDVAGSTLLFACCGAAIGLVLGMMGKHAEA